MHEGFVDDMRGVGARRARDAPEVERDSQPLVTPPPLPTEHERQAAEMPALPDIDPVAFFGTVRHPLSAPPAALDVPRPATALGRTHRTALAVGASMLLAAFFFGIARTSSSGSGDAAPRPASGGDPAQAAAVAGEPGFVPTTMMVAREKAPPAVSDGTNTPSETARNSSVEVAIPAVQIGATPAPPRRANPTPAAGAPAIAFDFAAAMDAVANARIGPFQCGPTATGNVAVTLTFAPSGEATRTAVDDGGFRETAAGNCVALYLRRVRVAPFDGGPATVRTTLALR
jgi:hypothetical protein